MLKLWVNGSVRLNKIYPNPELAVLANLCQTCFKWASPMGAARGAGFTKWPALPCQGTEWLQKLRLH